MSDPVPRSKLLFLDSDNDFLEDMKRLAETRNVEVEIKLFNMSDKKNLEDLILNSYPDLIVMNLDIDDALDFGNCVNEILHIPLANPPMIVGITSHDEISLKTKAYHAGVLDYLSRPFSPHDLWLRLDVLVKIRHLQRQFDVATRKLSTLNLKLSETNQKLEEMIVTDELTGLNNMRFMTQFLEKQFPVLKRHQRPFCIMMIDLDNFKQVNDKNDHLVGSAAIRQAGRIIDICTRGSDIKARYGGDEYIVAMPETDLAGAHLVAERLRQTLEKEKMPGLEGASFNVTASIGLAPFDTQRHTAFTDIIKDADRALYAAKDNGRNQVVVYTHAEQTAEYDESQSSALSEITKIRNAGKKKS